MAKRRKKAAKKTKKKAKKKAKKRRRRQFYSFKERFSWRLRGKRFFYLDATASSKFCSELVS